ncbi:MAG: GerW family sporulation protein [Clostridia bacterium]|nr:GerW family sporulation protein [Clostridia bacterium]
MSDHPIHGLMDTTLEKIKQMVDVNTIIGDPIVTPDGTTIIPVSKIVYGFASGGSEFANKQQPSANLFGGGGGAGVTINPVAFIAISHGDVKLLNITQDSSGQAIALVPEVFDKIVSLFKKDKNKKADEDDGLADPTV